MIEVRWHGRGGQGAFTAARLLGQAVAIHEHKFVQAFPSFGPERRGAPVLAFTRIDDKKVTDRSEVETCDYVVVLDDTLYGEAVTKGLKDTGILVINTTKDSSAFPKAGNYCVVTVDATALALDILGRPITNVPMLAALAAAAGNVSVDSVLNAIDDQLAPRIREKNKNLFLAAFNAVKGEA
ncbi:2-oxoacid:acceptor oxidoreductase family protein [uncultured Megasphaera sp.]|uniref:2-oxoacid:acceptor oxidoreductase family protein n=1 Tax=uncultured Megasphaera sp. TaxID=165188 RepID=UPI00265B6850|nr:2-oxoacid:acceptor oxidoreductase family protein [uncultured Megasphaera sp.]